MSGSVLLITRKERRDVISFSVYNAFWLECILLYIYQFLDKKYLKDTMQFVLYTFKYT